MTTYYSRLYRDFFALDFDLPRGVIYYYELHEDEIRRLDWDEYFEILVAYTRALYDSEEYAKHILMANAVVDATIIHNATLSNGEDVFEETLFYKAVSHYQLREYDNAKHILQELVRINPIEPMYVTFLKKNLRRQEHKHEQKVRASAIACILMAAMVTAVEVIVVRNFYMDYQTIVECLRIGLFCAGILIVIGDFGLRTLKAHFYVKDFRMLKNANRQGNAKKS